MRTTRGILPSVPLSRKMVWRWKQTKQYEAIFKLSSHINIKTITSWNHNLFHNFVANMRWHPWCSRLLWWWFHKWFGFCCQATLTALTLKVRPQIFSAGTDARILRELGIPTIGFFIDLIFFYRRVCFFYILPDFWPVGHSVTLFDYFVALSTGQCLVIQKPILSLPLPRTA